MACGDVPKCPACGNWVFDNRHICQSNPFAPLFQQGCVCPATSEQTCQAPLCPRKPLDPRAS